MPVSLFSRKRTKLSIGLFCCDECFVIRWRLSFFGTMALRTVSRHTPSTIECRLIPGESNPNDLEFTLFCHKLTVNAFFLPPLILGHSPVSEYCPSSSLHLFFLKTFVHFQNNQSHLLIILLSLRRNEAITSHQLPPG